ncbi:MAG TPA: NUDIX hydrolase [Candidatus Saccharimonadales bacterium]|nr:NUDIX hydrolase [Candidatus Saccharimonadales bacterium]
MADWKTLKSEIVYETPWIRVRRDEVLNQNGRPLTFSYMELQNPSVFIVATNHKGEILLQSAYRYTVGERFWEIPAGQMESDEQPLEAAKRELIEETGLVSSDWQDLGKFYQILGTGNVPTHCFLASNARSTGEATDKDEDIESRTFMSLEAIERMIKEGELVDSPVIAAIYMAKLHGLQKEEQ